MLPQSLLWFMLVESWQSSGPDVMTFESMSSRQEATIAGMAESSVSSGKYDSFIENKTVQRFGLPEDIARAVRFLLEPNSYITGQVLVVDGGLSLHS